MPDRKKLDIYTDGACSGNPGPGGWAAILLYNGHEMIASGGEPETTNNRMELKAVVGGLKALNQPCDVAVYSDSAYLIDALTKGWIMNWQRNGWKTSDKKDVKNREIWEELLSLSAQHHIKWVKVKGHSDNVHNNRCDEIARGEIDKLRNRGL